MTTDRDGRDGGTRARAPRRRRAGALLLAALLGGCALPAQVDDPGAAPAGSRAGVRFTFHPYAPGVAEPRVTFHFDDGRRRRTVSSADFSTAQSGTPYSPYFETAAEGSLRVTAVLQGAAGDTLAVGGLTLPLQPDRELGVSAAVNRRSVILSTPGIDAQRFRDYWPLRGQEGAADPVVLSLTHASRSISSPTPR